MTTDTPQTPGEGGGYAEGDLEYDLAHDAVGSGTGTPARRTGSPVQVATETVGYDGDLSYDLAHDVPRR
jgi:hypothetical protein